jgi:hypothetical protein
MVEKAKDESAGNAAMEESGVHKKHWDPMKKVCAEEQVVLYVRKTKASCRGAGTKSGRDWIGEGSVPKPHVVLNGSTIDQGNEFQQKTQVLFDMLVGLREAVGELDPALHLYLKDQGLAGRGLPIFFELEEVSPALFAEDFQGVIGHPAKNDKMAYPIFSPVMDKVFFGLGKRRPAYVDQEGRKLHRIVNDSGADYTGKWMTADYDLFDVVMYGKGCKRVTGKGFEALRKKLNVAMKWDGIQHGAQVHWVPEEDHGLSAEQRKVIEFDSMTDEVSKVLKAYKAAKTSDAKNPSAPKTDTTALTKTKKKISANPDRFMAVVDTSVTAVFGEGAVNLKNENDVVEALLCKECGE